MKQSVFSRSWLRLPGFDRARMRRVVLAIACALGLWGFVEVADEIAEDDFREIESSIIYSMRVPGDTADPIGPLWLEEAARDVTALGSFAILLLVVLGSAVFLYLVGKPRAAGFIIMASLSGALLSTLLKSGFDRPRPDLVAHQMHTLTRSFPSGHSLLSAVVYLSLGSLISVAYNQVSVKVFALTVSIIVTMLVGMTRVYLGVHWPTDVLGGWLMGASWAMVWWLLGTRFRIMVRDAE